MVNQNRNKMFGSIKMAMRMLKRDWRSGELRVLTASIVVAVTCVTAVVFFTDRIGQALKYQAAELIAADLRIVADHELGQTIYQKAHALKLKTADAWNFRSMVMVGDKNQLAEIKAVNEGYPLRGELRVANKLFTEGSTVKSIPQLGSVWVESLLLRQLSVNVGDDIYVGAKKFTVSGVITYEPDRSGDMFSIASRVMLNMKDLPETELVQEGSRIRYSVLIAGEKSNIEVYRQQLNTILQPGERIEGVEDARQEVRFALQRAQQFLGLAAIVSVILSCIAVAMSARRFAERHLNACAIMRCVGARQRQITLIFFSQLLVLSIFASLLGCALGFASQTVLADIIGELLVVQLPNASIWPVLTGLVVGMVGLTGFALPPVMRLKNVPTLRVLRRDLGSIPPLSLSSYAFGVFALAGLLLWQAEDLKLGVIMISGLLGATVILTFISFIFIKLIKFLPKGQDLAWRFGINNITRRPNSSVVQVLAFGVGIMVLLLLGVVRNDILEAWQKNLPEDASNRFVINIQPDQKQAVLDFFKEKNMNEVGLFPMVRGRLSEINGVKIAEGQQKDEHARRLVRREFNLSWAESLQADNKIVQGKWWLDPEQDQNQFSIELGIAETLGVGLGDKLTFTIAGEDYTAPITSVRTVQWDSFKPNFFVISPPNVLDSYPVSYITSFYLPSAQSQVLDDLIKSFPNLTIIDISAIMNQVRKIIDRVTLAIEYVTLFTVLAGLMVLYAAIQATQDERLQENAIMRAIGAKRKRLLKGIVTEFTILGALSGFMATAIAVVLGYILSVYVLELEYTHNMWIWPIGFLTGAVIVGLSGTLGTRKVLSKPPLTIIREN